MDLVAMFAEKVKENGGTLFRVGDKGALNYPDIHTLLDEQYQLAWDKRAQAGAARYYDRNRKTDRAYYETDENLKSVDALRTFASETTSSYVVVTNMKDYQPDEVFMPEMMTVSSIDVDLYRASISGDGVVTWTNTGNTAWEICCRDWTASLSSKRVISVHEEKYDIVWDERFCGTEHLYAYPENTDGLYYYVCKDCGEWFVLSEGEHWYFESKGLALPKRCRSCRDKRREQKEKPVAYDMLDLCP